MSTIWRLTTVLSIAALALFAALSAGAENPHPLYTCTKVKKNGDVDVQVHVPEPSIGGKITAGFTCVAESSEQGDRWN